MNKKFTINNKSNVQRLRFLASQVSKSKVGTEIKTMLDQMAKIIKELRWTLHSSAIKKALGVGFLSLAFLSPAQNLNAQNFLEPVKSFNTEFALDGFNIPNLVDIDDDGDLDIMGISYDITAEEFRFSFIENTGSADSPVFEEVIQDPMGLINPDGSFYGMGFSHDYADIDNDGDLDLFTTTSIDTNYNKVLNFFENIGDSNSPQFKTPVELAEINIGGLYSYYLDLNFADMDNDGDMDIMASGADYEAYYAGEGYKLSIAYVENIGTDSAPSFADGVIGAMDLDGISFASEDDFWLFSQLEVADFNNDGDLDIVVSGTAYEGNPDFYYYENMGGTFAQATEISNLSDLQDHVYLFNTFGDIDGDGDIDILAEAVNFIIDYDSTDLHFIENRIANADLFDFVELEGNYSVTPNISSDIIELRVSLTSYNDVQIYIQDSRGLLVNSMKMNQVKAISETLDIAGYPEGIYYIKMIADNKVKTLEFVKQ